VLRGRRILRAARNLRALLFAKKEVDRLGVTELDKGVGAQHPFLNL
jgi:hypothetical protein